MEMLSYRLVTQPVTAQQDRCRQIDEAFRDRVDGTGVFAVPDGHRESRQHTDQQCVKLSPSSISISLGRNELSSSSPLHRQHQPGGVWILFGKDDRCIGGSDHSFDSGPTFRC